MGCGVVGAIRGAPAAVSPFDSKVTDKDPSTVADKAGSACSSSSSPDGSIPSSSASRGSIEATKAELMNKKLSSGMKETCADDFDHLVPQGLGVERSPSFRKQMLNFIKEEAYASEEGRVLFLDVVLLGNHAQAAAEGACFDQVSRRLFQVPPSPSASLSVKQTEELAANVRNSLSSVGTAFSQRVVIDEVVEEEPPGAAEVEQPPRHSTASLSSGSTGLQINILGPEARPGSTGDETDPVQTLNSGRTSLVAPLPRSRSNSVASEACSRRGSLNSNQAYKVLSNDSRRSSNASMVSRASSKASAERGADLCCYCMVDGYHIRISFHPVERLNQHLPCFPGSHVASTGYVVLLPMESPDLDDVCSSLRQRLDEVRFQTRRAVQAEGVSAVDDPRLGRVELYNTVLQNILMREVDVKTSPASDSCKTSSELPLIQSSTQDMGTADLCDSTTLFQTLVVKTSEWLMSRGAVTYTSHGEKRRVE